MSNKRLQIPRIIVEDPDLQAFIDAVINNAEAANGDFGVSEKQPTVEDLVAAGVTNADKIK